MKTFKLLFIAAGLAAAFIVPAAAEPFEIVLKIEPTGSSPAIVGESVLQGHEGEIDVASFNMGVLQKGAAFAGGSAFGAGKSEFKPLTIYKFIDKATPALFVACATGARYKKATLVVTTAPISALAAPPERAIGDFFKIVLEDVFITSINQDANTTDGNGNLVETVDLSYVKISWFYTAANGDIISGGFDVKKNQKFTPVLPDF